MGMAKLLAWVLFLTTLLTTVVPPAGHPPEAGLASAGGGVTRSSDVGPLPSGHTAGFTDTSEYLLGSVAVSVFLVESDGTGDVQTENWTAVDVSAVQTEVQDALAFWAAAEPRANVTFNVSFETPTVTVEPINRVCGWDPGAVFTCEEGLWVNEVMLQKGYGSGTPFFRVRTYLNDRRTALGTDWAFAAFVLNSANDTDGRFAAPPGGTSAFAYSWMGGPWLFLTRDNAGIGLGGLNEVFAHEMGHIFYATDEYNGLLESSGYRNAADEEGSGCLMDTGLPTCLSNGTREQVGWTDVDVDGYLDPVGEEPDTALTVVPPAANPGQNLTYRGNATIPALPNLNPLDAGNDIQVADVVNVSYSLDSGPWVYASPDDGAFDGDEEPFTVNLSVAAGGPHSIEVCATSSVVGREIICATDAFTVDFTLPSSFINAPGFTITNNPVLGLLATATDDGPIQEVALWYRRDAGAWTLHTTDFVSPYAFTVDTGPIGDGTYEFYTVARDQAANIEAAPALPDVTITVDTLAPVTTTSAIPPSWALGDWGVTFTPSEPGNTSFRVNGGTWVEGTFVLVYTEGVNTLEFYSRDLAGNSEAVKNATVRLDKTLPVATMVPLAPLRNDSAISLDWNASDAVSGVAATQLYYRSAGAPTWTFLVTVASPPYAWTLSNDGAWEFAAIALDVAGNSEGAPAAVEASTTLDTEAPSSTIVGLPRYHAALSFNVTVNSTDADLDHVELWVRYEIGSFVLIGNATSGNATLSVDGGSTGQGTYTLYSAAVDIAGNREAVPAIVDETILDVAPPAIVVRAPTPAPGWLLSPDVRLRWNMTDAVSGVAGAEVRVDGGAWADVGLNTSETLAGLADGSHAVQVRATDRAGNVQVVTWNLQVDTTPPQVSILTPRVNETIGNDTAIVNWTLSDSTSGVVRVTLTLNGELILDNSTSTNRTLTSLPVGANTVVVTAYDAAGISGTATVTFIVPQGPGTDGTTPPFSLWPVVFLIAVVLAVVLLFLISRRRRRAVPQEFEDMHRVEPDGAERPAMEETPTEEEAPPPRQRPAPNPFEDEPREVPRRRAGPRP